ncbi:hypothetical protein ABIE67_010159 [Streptomyces sp. V4I8]|uniref:DUF3068 domain-containing protein n=1 Tax=Streptomyces sp. V4I8 TaxID=3156469 RepID=UPI003519D305
MRKLPSPMSLVLLGVGSFLLVLAPLLAWYVEPRVKLMPINTDVTTALTGTGSYFDQNSVSVKKNQKITVTQRALGDVADSERTGYAVIDMSSTVDTPETLRLKDPRKSLEWSRERFVVDRSTNRPVHCCGEKPYHQGEAYVKFPFDVQERDYRWWDGTLRGTVLLRFAGIKKIQGHEGYRFTGTVEPTKRGTRQVPGALVGLPKQKQVIAEEWYANAGIELTVDQRTGQIMNVKTAPEVTLRAPGSKYDAVTLLRSGGLEMPPAMQREQVEFAAKNSRALELVAETAPKAGGLVGSILAFVGGVWVVRGSVSGGRHSRGG